MSTVAQVIDRTYREYLEPPSKQPAMVKLKTDIDNAVTAVVYEEGYLTSDEQDAAGPGKIIGVDLELMLITKHAEGARTWTVLRGHLGTTKAAHTAADPAMITIGRPISRVAVFDAIADTLEGFYDDLYRRRTIQINTSGSPVEITNGDAERSIKYQFPITDVTDTRWAVVPVEILRDNATWTSLNAIQFIGVPSGRAGYLTYAARFPRPTLESDILDESNFDLPVRWERVLIVGAVAQVISGVPIDAINPEFIVDAIRAQGFPVGSGRNILQTVLQFYDFLLQRAKRDLTAQDEISTEWGDIVLIS